MTTTTRWTKTDRGYEIATSQGVAELRRDKIGWTVYLRDGFCAVDGGTFAAAERAIAYMLTGRPVARAL
jgi:hypothetical protein